MGEGRGPRAYSLSKLAFIRALIGPLCSPPVGSTGFRSDHECSLDFSTVFAIVFIIVFIIGLVIDKICYMLRYRLRCLPKRSEAACVDVMPLLDGRSKGKAEQYQR